MRKLVLTILLSFLVLNLSTADEIFHSNVFIAEESYFADGLDEALSFEAEGKYDDALSVYFKLLNKAEKWSKEHSNGQPFYKANLYYDIYHTTPLMARYLPVEDYIIEQISTLPKEAKNRFSQRVSGTAKLALEAALKNHDRAAVQRIADRYWLAHDGDYYLQLAGQLAFEAGDFQIASNYFGKLYKAWETKFDDNPIRVLYLGASLLAAKREYDFKNYVEEAKRRYKGLSITINKKFYPDITELLEREKLSKFINEYSITRKKLGYQVWGGDETHSLLAPDFDNFLGAAKQFQNPVQKVGTPRTYDYYYGRRTKNAYFNVPAVFENTLVFAGLKHLLLLDIDKNGYMHAKYPEIPFPKRGNFPKYTAATQALFKFYPVLSGNYLYGVFQQNSSASSSRYRRRGISNSRVLCCLDIEQEGKLVWWVPGDIYNSKYTKQQRDLLSKIVIDNAIVVVGDRLYATGLLPLAQETEYYLLCFDATPDEKVGGRLLWYRELATELSPSLGWRGYSSLNTPSFSALTYDGGLLYLLTNTGIFVCADAVEGRIKYILRYMRPRNVVDSNRNRWTSTGASLYGTHFQFNPVFSFRGNVYIAPMDARKCMS